MKIDLKFSFCFKALNSQEKENLNNVYNYSFKLSSHRKRKDPSEIRTPRKNLNFNDALLMQKIQTPEEDPDDTTDEAIVVSHHHLKGAGFTQTPEAQKDVNDDRNILADEQEVMEAYEAGSTSRAVLTNRRDSSG